MSPLTWYFLGLATLPTLLLLGAGLSVVVSGRHKTNHDADAIDEALASGSKPASDDPADIAAWRLDKIFEFSSYHVHPNGPIGGYAGSWHDGSEAEIAEIIRRAYAESKPASPGGAGGSGT